MSKLLMLSGLPASGKSTFAKELVEKSGGGWVRVNKDLLRTMLHADKFTYSNEKQTAKIEHVIASHFLMTGFNVIVDDTNLGERHEKEWKATASVSGAQFSKRRFKTSFEECLKRNKERGLTVPQSAIHRMAVQNKMIEGHWKPIIICDLDGTIANLEHRLHYIKKDDPTPEDYKNFYSEVMGDSPIQDVLDTVTEEYEAGKTIIFVSGRSDISREDTEAWLEKYAPQIKYSALLMRDSKDRRPDTMVKEDFLKKVLKDYTIEKVYDDRPSVIRMWRENGLEVIDCGDGIEF